ncbi:hypothetical protein LTS18_011232, partial [Coniosporium uncinatum]
PYKSPLSNKAIEDVSMEHTLPYPTHSEPFPFCPPSSGPTSAKQTTSSPLSRRTRQHPHLHPLHHL